MSMTPVVQEIKRLKTRVLVALAILVALVLALGWASDYRSCLRSAPVRAALREDSQLARDSIPFWEARNEPAIVARLRRRVEIENVESLDCFHLLPDI